jgi:large subunit ribosomal protein L29
MSTKQLPFKDVAEKSLKELILLRRNLKKELFDARMKNALKSLKETHIISVLRKNIARINTALTSKNTNH